MKPLLIGVVVAVALAYSAPVWAEPACPSASSPREMAGPKASGTNYVPLHRHVRAHPAVHGRMAHGSRSTTQQLIALLTKFEQLLEAQLNGPPDMPQLCEVRGVSDQTLRTGCAELLGMLPPRYMLLRRLRNVRSELRDADPIL